MEKLNQKVKKIKRPWKHEETPANIDMLIKIINRMADKIDELIVELDKKKDK